MVETYSSPGFVGQKVGLAGRREVWLSMLSGKASGPGLGDS